MNIEYQKRIILIFLQDTLVYVYCTRSISDSMKIFRKYINPLYEIKIINLEQYEKIDRTIFKLYDYHDEIFK